MEVLTRRPLRKIAVFFLTPSEILERSKSADVLEALQKSSLTGGLGGGVSIKWICPNIIYLYSSGRGGGINVKGFFCVVMSKNGAMRCIINTRYFPECLF